MEYIVGAVVGNSAAKAFLVNLAPYRELSLVIRHFLPLLQGEYISKQNFFLL